MYREALAHGSIPERFVPLVQTAVEGRADYTKDGWEDFFTLFERAEIECIPNDATHFIYEDAVRFLEVHGKEVVVVTAGRQVIQERKVERTQVRTLVSDVIYAGRGLKGPVLASRFSKNEKTAFVDDSPTQLASVAEHCPWITLYELQRDRSDSGKFTLIRTLDELL